MQHVYLQGMHTLNVPIGCFNNCKAHYDEKLSRSSQELALHVLNEHCFAILRPGESTKELECLYIKKLYRKGGRIFLSSCTCFDRTHGHQLRQLSAWKQS